MSTNDARLYPRNRAVQGAQPARWLALCVLLLLMPALAAAQAAPRPEQLIKWRQSAYQAVAWNSARIKAALSGGAYDAAEVRVAADTLAALAASGLPSLFPAGTGKGKGWRETTARDTVFSDAKKFRELSDAFAREAALLAKATAGSDQKAVQEQFLKVAQACKSCHEKFRQTD